MSLRIGIDYTPAVRQGAGIGRYTRGLVRALARLDRENRYTLFMAHGSEPHQRYQLSGSEKVLLIGEPTDDVALFEELLIRKGVTVIVASVNQALAVLRQQMPHQAWLFSWTEDRERTPSLAALVAGHPTAPDTQGRTLPGRPVQNPGLSPRATAFGRGCSFAPAGQGP
jgi:hypothetical protein